MSWKLIEGNDVTSLDEFGIYLRGCLNALQNIPHGMSEIDSKAIRQMLGRLPWEATEKWRVHVYNIEEREERKPDFEDFVCFVEKFASIAAKPWYERHMFPTTRNQRNRNTLEVQTMAGSSGSRSESCTYCRHPHDVSECKELASLSEEAKKK